MDRLEFTPERFATMMLMTRTKMYGLTAIAAALYVGLGIAFGNGWGDEGIFSFDKFFKGSDPTIGYTGSSWLSYVLFAAIIGAGVFFASRIPEDGVQISAGDTSGEGQVHDPQGWRLLLGNTYLAVLWLPIRFFVGQEWLAAGEHKVRSDAWMDGGTALQGYWTGATTINPETGASRITYDWFYNFITYMLDNEWYTWFAKVVAIGEFLVGLGLVVGALVGIAAFFGTVLNFSFLMAGTVSSNPVLFGLAVFLVLGWKVAGWIGLDRFLLPLLGTPWQMGKIAGDHKDAPLVGGQPHPQS